MSHLPNARKKRVNKNVARLKQKNSYPAVIIGRLGVSKNFQGLNVGAELMDFIKAWFIDSGNKTGCRFVVVDAYNEERPIRYYQKCGFDFLIPDKTAELKYTRNTVIKDAVDLTEPKEEDAVFLDTRLMFFDLIRLRC
jgi:predicted N-acetyltransferase YhbS